MKILFIFLFLSKAVYSQVNLRPRNATLAHANEHRRSKSSTKVTRSTQTPPEVNQLNHSTEKLEVFIEKYRERPAIWDFSLTYDFKTASVIKGRLLNSVVSTNLESPIVIEIHPEQGLPDGTVLSCLGMTKFKRVVTGCSRLITPGASGEEYDVEISILNKDGTAGLTGEYYTGKELYVAGMIASSFARGSIELSQSRIATTGGELKVNSAKNRYLEGILNSADEASDLMKKEMQTSEPKVFVKAGKEVLIYFNQRFKI
jgi:hypothetical protein